MQDRSRNTGFKIFLGILLLILGIITITAQLFTTIATIYFLGWVLLIGGFLEFFNGFFTKENRWLLFMGGVLSFIFGYILITNPIPSATFLTLLIGMWLLISGAFKLIASVMLQYENWGWSLFGGIITLLLGAVVLSQWPVSGLWVIGLFIGVEFIVRGLNLIAAPSYQSTRVEEPRQTPYFSGVKGGKAKKKEDEA